MNQLNDILKRADEARERRSLVRSRRQGKMSRSSRSSAVQDAATEETCESHDDLTVNICSLLFGMMTVRLNTLLDEHTERDSAAAAFKLILTSLIVPDDCTDSLELRNTTLQTIICSEKEADERIHLRSATESLIQARKLISSFEENKRYQTGCLHAMELENGKLFAENLSLRLKFQNRVQQFVVACKQGEASAIQSILNKSSLLHEEHRKRILRFVEQEKLSKATIKSLSSIIATHPSEK